MPQRRGIIIALFAIITLLIAGACGNDTETTTTPTPATPSSPNSLKAQLLQAQSRWERSGIRSYTYRAAWQCFCISEAVAQVDVRVIDGQVTEIAFADPGFTGDVPDPERFGTIEDLFGFIEEAIVQGASRIDVQFHPDLGYPSEAFVDFDALIADEEQGFTVLTLAAN